MKHTRLADPLRTGVLLAALASLLSPLAAAEPAQRTSEDRIREDLDFARGLAEDWQFVSLAEKVLEGIDPAGASEEVREAIGLTRCQVYASSARRERDDERRLELYEKALDSYSDYIEDNIGALNLPEARAALVNLANSYSQELYRRYQQAVGEEAETLKETIADVLDDAISRVNEEAGYVDDEIRRAQEEDSSTASLEREYYELMLNKAQMNLTLAQVSDISAGYFVEAEESLFEILDRAGDTSYWGLLAYSRLGELYTAQSQYQDASDYLSYVVQSTVPFDRETRALEGGFDDLSPLAQEGNFRFVDNVTGDLVNAYVAQGEPASAMRAALHFVNCLDQYGFQMTRPNGYLSMLEVSRALLDAGGFIGGNTGEYEWFQSRDDMVEAGFRGRRNTRSALDLSLQLAQQVNRENRGNILQLYSQRVISDIIDRGVDVDPEVLFEAAQGAYFEDRFVDAIQGFKRVLGVLETADDATRTRLGPQVFYHIGRSLQKSGRELEAAVAFRSGLEPRWVGDPKYDPENAKQYHATIRRVRSRASGDALLESKFREAQDLVLKHQSSANSAGDILYSQAKLAYDQKEYDDALAKFAQVPQSSKEFEKAKVYAAVTLNKLGQPEQALAGIRDYLESYVNDPVNKPDNEVKVADRQAAMGLATYYGGLIAFNQAETGAGSHAEVVEWLEGYAERFEDQTAFAPKAIYMVLKSHLVQGDYDDAEASRDELIERFPNSPWTGHAALALYQVYEERRNEADEGDDTSDLTRRMANSLKLFNTLGGSPSLSYMYNEGKLWLELEEWKEAERVLARAANTFGSASDEKTQSQVERLVRPSLAHAQLRQQKVRDAFDLLNELIGDDEKPDPQLAHDFSLAVTGWVEAEGDQLAEVAGVGGEENFPRAAEYLDKLADAEEAWELPWYRLKFEVAYAYYQWGKVDGKQAAIAQEIIDQLQSDMADTQMNVITEAANGDDTLRQKFLWLEDQL